MIPECICNNVILNMFSSIGCSGIAASIMAIYIEQNNEKKERIRLNKAKSLYFSNINSELNMLIERILWFDERMKEEQFNWTLPLENYSSFKYMLWANVKYKEVEISYEKAKEKLKVIEEKYSLEKQNEMAEEEKIKIYKMFCIIANSSECLLKEVNMIEKNKLTLDMAEYLPLDKVKSLIFGIPFGIQMMNSPGKNYSAAIRILVDALDLIRETGQYTDNIRIGLHGSISVDEI